VLALSVVLIGTVSWIFYQRVILAEEKEAAAKIRDIMYDEIDAKLELLKTVAILVAEDPRIIEAFGRDDYTIADAELKI